ncbi:uncharacterized protein LOC132315979 isoform X2 [Cornus florida]|uniref:uncharacterized protein LOC132315979 isoform X2 n=1 Tax=Cornus florida TaxID=4283 RepID=UPI0028A27E77|nr:uncharacterized protein LOC132315979 isoform X2 [Cornus florida]
MQMLQRHIMLKQLQELKRQQQLQELGNARQQTHINQLSAINKQADGGQFSPLINGTPIHDVSQHMGGNMNLVQHATSQTVQGFPNGLVYSQAQSQPLRSMGQVPQQLEAYLYGTPIASARDNLSQYSHLQGISQDSGNVLIKHGDNHTKPTMQSSAFSNSFLGDHCNVPSDQIFMSDGAFISKQVGQGKNSFGQVPIRDLNSGVIPENFQQVNSVQMNASQQDFNGRREPACWPGLFPEKPTQVGHSQGLATLDPLEKKILFNMDDNSWDASFARPTDISTGGCGNTLECTDFLSSFPSIQSGSWSALMQSAVAETSSSDTGLQEQWSGLSFQNTEPSTGNQPSNFTDTGKQQTDWVDSHVQSVPSLSSKPLFNDSTMRSVFPGLQQPNIQNSIKQREIMRSDSSHESIHQPCEDANKWSYCKPQQKQPIEGGHPVPTLRHLENAWPAQYAHSENDEHQKIISSYRNDVQSPSGNGMLNVCNNENAVNKIWAGDINEAFHKDPGSFWKPEKNSMASLTKACHDTSQHTTESGQFDYMEQVDISLKNKGSESMGDDQYRPSNSPQVVINSYERPGETYKKQQICYQRENSGGSYHSSASQQAITGHEVRENVWLHESDSRPVAGDKQMSSGQVVFQQVSQGSSGQGQGYIGQFKFIGNDSNGAMDLEKWPSPNAQRNSKASEEVTHRGNAGANLSVSNSKNMLELLNKVDHEGDHNIVARFGSSNSETLTELPKAETPDASIAQHYDYSSASQGYGLMLSPPSQQLPNSMSSFSSPSTTQMAIATTPSGPPYSRNHLQRQHIPASQATLPGRLPCATSQATSHPNFTNLFGQQFPILESIPVTQASVMSGMSQQVGFSIRPPSAWQNVVPTQRYLSGTESCKVSSNLLSTDSTNNRLETTQWAAQELHDQNPCRGGTASLEIGACSVNLQGFNHGEEQLGKERFQQQISSEMVDSASHTDGKEFAKHLSEANAIGSDLLLAHSQHNDFDGAQHGVKQGRAVSARDIEAFGRSLKPLPTLHQNYSMLHQAHAVKDVESDPSKRFPEKHSGAGPDLNLQQVSQINSFPSRDINMLNFSSEVREHQSVKNLSQHLQDAPQEMVTLGQSYSQSHSASRNEASYGKELSQINLQMAPSVFKYYGTLRNGQMLPMYDARAAKNAAQLFPLGKPSENLHMNASMFTINAPDDSQQHLEVIDQNLAAVRPKKRKISIPDFLPWHKEVTQGSWRLKSISMAELEWAQATNRLIEKVEDEAERTEDLQPMLRPKKRLILTTHLMQQMFRPAPAAILSAGGTSNFDAVVYFAARVALGDACSLTSYSGSDSCLSSNSYDTMSGKLKTPERHDEQYFSKTVDDFTNRAKKLETDLLRLDQRASLLDIRVESQDLEKFSVINRFAKFHSRSQANPAETSSSSGTAPKPFPQRYVTAVPMPSTIPEGGKCVSL